MIIRSIKQIIDGRPLHAVAPDATARDACAALKAADVGALTVMEGDRLVGILSERDVIRKCIAGGRRTDETRVAEIMTPDPVTVQSDTKVADAMEAMVTGGFRHLPGMEGDRVAGMLSMRDIPTEYRLMFERFTEYMQGTPDRAMA